MAEVDSNNSWNHDDDDDDDGKDPSYTSTFDSDSIVLLEKEQETPLSLYWFIDEDENHKNSVILAPIQTNDNNDHSETKILQDKIQSMEKEFSSKLHSMEENIKNLVSLLQNQQK